MTLAQALFSPRSVALVGASGDAAKNTARPQRYLSKYGYARKIAPIDASRSEVLGLKSYGSMKETPYTIDHAFIMVSDVEGALEDCGSAGEPVATIFTDGFADAGAEGTARQQRRGAPRTPPASRWSPTSSGARSWASASRARRITYTNCRIRWR
jgi:acyl-CoA synthetase (NDP forming)